MKTFLLTITLFGFVTMTYAQQIKLHKNDASEITEEISAIDSITFTNDIIIHKNNGNNLTENLSAIDSITFITDNNNSNLPVIGDSIMVYPEDNADDIEWSNLFDEINDGNGAASNWDGAGNTSAIIATLGDVGAAAYVCDTLTGYGYDDWYLPAKDELDLMYQNKNSIGGFSTIQYWSSTKDLNNNERAWVQFFNTGYQSSDLKYYSHPVRCVRKY